MLIRKGLRSCTPLTLYLLLVACLQTLATPVMGDLRLSGDERIAVPLSLANFYTGNEAGVGHYCVWYERAENRQRDWQVRLLAPEQGFALHPYGHAGSSVPIEVSVQNKQHLPWERVRREMVISQGDILTSHCGSGDHRFRISVMPIQTLSSIKAGRYQQRLRLRLTSDALPSGTSSSVTSVDFDVLLVLDMPELISAKGEHNTIILPSSDGHTPSIGTTNFCLFRNGGGEYSVRLSGDGPAGQFVLKGAGLLSYRAFWQANSGTLDSLQPGRQSQNYSGSAFRDCRGTHNATVQIEVPVQEAEKAHSGRYQGNLRVTVQAQ